MSCYSNRIKCKLFTIFLLLFPFLNVYSIPKINMGIGEAIMIIIMLVFFLASNFKIKIENKIALIFLIYAIIITFFSILRFPSINPIEPIKRILRDLFYISVVWWGAKYYFDYKVGYRILNNLSCILSIFILLQFVSYIAFKVYIPGLLNGLAINGLTAEMYKLKALKDAAILGYLRPNGFFSEPAQCAHFLSLAILINLFWEKKKVKLFYNIILYTLAIIYSTSLNGIILLLVVYIIYFLDKLKTCNKQTFIKIMSIFATFLFFVFIICFKISYIGEILSRLKDITTNPLGSSSMRTMRGIVFFSKMPVIDKFFGIGFGNFIGYRKDTGIWSIYEVPVEYFNTNAYLLISIGIIGCIFLFLAIIKYIKKRDKLTFVIFFLLFTMGSSSSIYSTPTTAIALAFALFRKKYNNENFEQKTNYKNNRGKNLN